MKKGVTLLTVITLIMTCLLLIACGGNGEEENGATESIYDMQLIKCDESRIDNSAYAGKTFTGAVVQIEYPSTGSTATFDVSSVTAEKTNGDEIEVEFIFLISVDGEIQDSTLLGGTQMQGLTIYIGEDEYNCFGNPSKMALDIHEGGLVLALADKGTVEMGFIFSEKAENLESLNILDATVTLP